MENKDINSKMKLRCLLYNQSNFNYATEYRDINGLYKRSLEFKWNKKIQEIEIDIINEKSYTLFNNNKYEYIFGELLLESLNNSLIYKKIIIKSILLLNENNIVLNSYDNIKKINEKLSDIQKDKDIKIIRFIVNYV